MIETRDSKTSKTLTILSGAQTGNRENTKEGTSLTMADASTKEILPQQTTMKLSL